MQQFPKLMSVDEFKKASNENFFIEFRRSASMEAIDKALEEYQQVTSTYLEKAGALFVPTPEDGKRAKAALDKLRQVLDHWCSEKSAEYAKRLADNPNATGTWQDSKRAPAVLELRRQAYSTWFPMTFSAEEVQALQYIVDHRQTSFRALLAGRRLENQVMISLRKSKEAASNGQLTTAAAQGNDAAQRVSKQVKPLKPVAEATLAGLRELLTPLVERIAALIKEVAGRVREAAKRFEKKIAEAWSRFLTYLTDLYEAAQALLAWIGETLSEILKECLEPLQKLIRKIADFVRSAEETVEQFLNAVEAAAAAALKAVIDALSEAIEAMSTPLRALLRTLMSAWTKGKQLVQTAIDFLAKKFNEVEEFLNSMLDAAAAELSAAWRKTQQAITLVYKTVEQGVIAVAKVVEKAVAKAVEALQKALGVLGELWRNLEAVIKEGLEQAKEFAQEVVQKIAKPVKWLIDAVRGAVQYMVRLFAMLLNEAQEIFRQIADWISQMASMVYRAADGVIRWLRDLLGAIFGIDLLDLLLGLLPFIGTAKAVGDAVGAWVSVYKAGKEKSQLARAQFAFAHQSTVRAALVGLDTALTSGLSKALVDATTQTTGAVIRILIDASGVAAAAGSAVGVATILVKASESVYRFIEAWRETERVNKLLDEWDKSQKTGPNGASQLGTADASLSLETILKESPLLCCYMLRCSTTSDLLHMAFHAHMTGHVETSPEELEKLRHQRAEEHAVQFGEANWMVAVAELKRAAEPVLDSAAKIIREAPFGFDGLREYAAEPLGEGLDAQLQLVIANYEDLQKAQEGTAKRLDIPGGVPEEYKNEVKLLSPMVIHVKSNPIPKKGLTGGGPIPVQQQSPPPTPKVNLFAPFKSLDVKLS